jgi:hypothetical protein
MNASIAQPARALVDPVDGVPQAVAQKRWVLPTLAYVLASTFSGLAVGLRLDVTQEVMMKLQMGGQLANLSDQDLADKLTSAQHLAIVGGVAKGIFLAPLLVVLVAVVLKFASWLLGKKVLFKKCLSVSAVAFLPLALYHVALGVSALYQLQIPPMKVEGLVPSTLAAVFHPKSPKLLHVLSGLDYFNLWSTVLLGLGYAEASGMKRRRALVFAFVLYAVYVGVFVIGVPALMAMGAGGPHK